MSRSESDSDGRADSAPGRDLRWPLVVDAPSGVLDPGDPRPASRRLVHLWLRIQAGFALRPHVAVQALRSGTRPEALASGAERGCDVEAAARALVACGARLLPFDAPAYPARLRRLSDAPPVLLVQGDLYALAGPAVGIVGARAATSYGRRTARRFGEDLARVGVTVVSGLARGIDGQAHEGALAAGGLTVAVQARGPDRVYPAQHRDLAARIAKQGVVLSELPPGTPPRAPFFPMRNRLISALSDAVLVVEARQRSGSLVTARHALDQGIEVLAVPGPIDVPTSEGTNGLLRDGASPALEPDDVLAALGIERGARADGGGAGRSQVASAAVDRDPATLAILAMLADGPATRDELSRRLDRPPELLGLALTELELDGAVAEDREGRLELLRRP